MAVPPSQPPSRTDQAAARGDPQQQVFAREVDDALREDQLHSAMRRFGVPVAAVVLAALAGLAAFLWWQGRQAAEADQGSERLVVALDRIEGGQLAPADAALATLAGEAGKGYAALSRLTRAGLAVEQGREAQAQQLFAQVAADGEAPQPFRDLATVRDVALRFDSLQPDQVVARLKPLAVPGNPWFGSAGELVAAAYLKQGKADLAGPLLAAMAKDEGVPATVRSRARQLAGVLGIDTIVDADQAAAGSPVAQAGPTSQGNVLP